MYLTYQDGVDHLVGYLGSPPQDDVIRDAKRAVLDAYRDLGNAFHWSYLYHHGRIITVAPYDGSIPPTVPAATVGYTHTGGQYERMLTLAGGVWPYNAAATYVRVGFVIYRAAERKSATILTLDPEVNPGVDLPAGTPFTAYQDTYLLPEDYITQDQALYEGNFGGLSYTHPREWLFASRYTFSSGTPQCFTITGDPQYPGRLVFRCFPLPDATRSIDFVYHRRPRALTYYMVAGGIASVAAGSTTVTGTGTAFTPSMVGSVLRLSLDGKPPTGETGKNPPALEALVGAWVSPTALVLADPSPITLTGVSLVLSDPVDIEPGSMSNVFRRACEMHLSMVRVLKDKPSARVQYLEALDRARSADSRTFAGRSVGPQNRLGRRRLRDMPVGPDQP